MMYKPDSLGDWPLEIMRLDMNEANSLSVITIRCQYKEVRGGNAPTTNLKKTGVSTGHWRKEDVTTNLTANAKAARRSRGLGRQPLGNNRGAWGGARPPMVPTREITMFNRLMSI